MLILATYFKVLVIYEISFNVKNYHFILILLTSEIFDTNERCTILRHKQDGLPCVIGSC